MYRINYFIHFRTPEIPTKDEICTALGDLLIEHDEHRRAVYVESMDVDEAVEILNRLGFETDEDKDEDEE